jgi:hypothetical protein
MKYTTWQFAHRNRLKFLFTALIAARICGLPNLTNLVVRSAAMNKPITLSTTVGELKEAKRRIRALEKSLKELTYSAGIFLRQLDGVMKQPESGKRGKLIAELANRLEYARDSVRYFTLGIDYRKDPETIKDKASECIGRKFPSCPKPPSEVDK